MSRQPLFPDSTKEAVDLAEMMDGGGHSKQRRENFAKTAQSKFFFCNPVQVNLCQKLLFLHQLTHSMTTDCSLNYNFNT